MTIIAKKNNCNCSRRQLLEGNVHNDESNMKELLLCNSKIFCLGLEGYYLLIM
jgi:hypothetical protein